MDVSSEIQDAPRVHVHEGNGIPAGQLRSIVERIERLEEDIKELNADKSEVYSEAKSNGFDPRIIRQVVALRRKPASERQENATLLDLYLSALGEVA